MYYTIYIPLFLDFYKPNIFPFEDMDPTEYKQIRDYLSSQLIPPEMKSDRYQRKNFLRKCKGISFQDNKLMKVIFGPFIRLTNYLPMLLGILDYQEEEWSNQVC